jgi:hypothetical protein
MTKTVVGTDSPWGYLEPFRFVTGYDRMAVNVNSGLAHRQYQKGLDIGAEYSRIQIDSESVWTATLPNSKTILSYEKIGYHACTSDLLAGFLGSDAAIIVSNLGGSCTQIKPKGYWIRHEDQISPRQVKYLIGRTNSTTEFYSSEYRSDIAELMTNLGR